MKTLKILGMFSCLCLVTICCFSGCAVKPEELAKNNLSELHLNYFVGETLNFSVSLWSGYREEPYSLNGVKADLVEFCVVNVVPKNTTVSTFGLSYTVEINEKTYEGQFEDSPFDNSLGADLEVKVNDADSIFVYIIADGESEISKLECISSAFQVNQTQAMDIAIEAAKEKILTLSDNGNESIEGHCKIISTDKNLGIYFWFVSFINSSSDKIALIIDTTTGEIVAEM